jgi:hypothetical protein
VWGKKRTYNRTSERHKLTSHINHRYVNKGLKVGIGLAIVAGIGYAMFRAGKQVVDGLSYKVKGFDLPKLSGNIVTVPIKIEFTSASPVPVPVSRVQINASYQQNKAYVHAGTLDQSDIIIQPGVSVLTFYPQLDLKALFSKVIQTITTLFNNKSLNIKADIALTVAGATINETVYHTIPISI